MTAQRATGGPYAPKDAGAGSGAGPDGATPPQGRTALRDRLVRALARTVYRSADPPPRILAICEPWADDIATEVEAWAAEQTQQVRDAPPTETECPAWAWHACACPQQCEPEPKEETR